MKFIDILKLSTRMFRARTSRTFLTILGMGVGIAAIVFLVSFGYGLQETLLERITTSESLLTLDVTEANAEGDRLNKETLEKIKKMEGVEEVSPAFSLPAQGRIGDLTSDLQVVGIQSSFLRLGGFKMKKGEVLSDAEKESVVVTSSIAQVFNQDEEKIIGQEMIFTFFPEEQGVVGTKNSQSKTQKIASEKKYKIRGLMEGDENTVYLHSETLENLNINHFSQVKVRCANEEKMALIREELLGKNFLVSSLSETVEQAKQVFKFIQIVLMLFGVIALVVSAIGMFNTMTITLLERTEEIGIMKSIGASNWGISWIFLMESTIMGFLGGLGGVVLGLIGGKFFNLLINFVATKMGGEAATLFHSPLWFTGLIIIFAGIVGFFTGLVPARRASKINPLDALRYK